MSNISQNQLAVMNIHYIYYPLEHFFRTMQELGVKNVDLWAGYPHFYMEEETYKDKASEILSMCRRYGTNIICCTPEQIRYPINIADTDPEVRKRTLKYLHTTIEAAAALESPLYQIVPGRGYYDSPIDSAWNCMCEELGELAEHAGRLGMHLVLEPLQIIESNLVGSAESAHKLLQDVGSPYLKIVVDTCHMAVKGEELQHYFDVLKDDIYHIHLNESDQVPWGEGHLPLDEYLSVLGKNNYNRYFTLEICSYIHQVYADDAVKANVNYVRNAIARI